MFPGSNLLNEAFMAIQPIEIQWLKYVDRVLSPARILVSGYRPAVPVLGSVQAVSRSRYADMGLDYTKNYVMAYLSHDVRDLDRDGAPDRFILPDQRTYEVMGETDWFGEDGSWTRGINGWTGVLLVRLGKDAATKIIPETPSPEVPADA